MIQDTELTITYDHEKADAVSFGFYYHRKRDYGPVFSNNWAVVILLGLIAYGLYQMLWLRYPIQYGMWLAFGFYGLFVLSFRVQQVYGILFWPQIRKAGYARLGPTTIHFGRENIKICSGDAEQHFTWKSFDNCVATDRYLFLCTASEGGFLVPKRAFLLEQEAYDFVLFIKKNLSENNP